MTTTKRIYNIFIISCCFIFLASCRFGNKTAEVDSDIYKLNVRSIIDSNEVNYYLSELTDEIKYVRLETDTSCFLKFINWLDIAQDYIFVSDFNGLYQFDKSGQFIREIGRIGKGPGEHNGRIRFAIDEYQNEVYIHSSFAGLINVHDLETGMFKSSFTVDFNIYDFVVLPEGVIAFFTWEEPYDANEVYFTDRRGNKIDSITNNLRTNIRGNLSGHASVYFNNNNIYYLYNYRDTLYHINNEFERKPFAVFTLNNKDSHNDFIITPPTDVTHYPDFISIPKILNNKNLIFATLQKGIVAGSLLRDQDLKRMVYDKSAGHLSMTSGFINDIDGGMTFWPQWFRDDVLIEYYQPYQIIDYYNDTKNSIEHSEEFINLANSLNEDDNPVLVLVKQNF